MADYPIELEDRNMEDARWAFGGSNTAVLRSARTYWRGVLECLQVADYPIDLADRNVEDARWACRGSNTEVLRSAR